MRAFFCFLFFTECVWGVTARSLHVLFVIRDGANMTTVVRKRAPTRALSNFSLPNGVSVFPGGSTRTPVLRPSLPRRRPPSPAVFRPPRPRPGLGLRLLFLLFRARGFPRFPLNRGPPSCSSSRALRSLFEWGFLLPTFVSDVRLQARTEFRRFPRPSFLPRSGGSSSSCPFWAAPAPSAFTAWSGAQPFPAVPSGSIRSPSLLAALHLASPGFLPAALFFATVSLPARFRSRHFSSSPSPPRCSRLPHDVSIVLERPLNSAGATT